MAAAQAAKEALWIRKLVGGLQLELDRCIVISADNQGALKLYQNLGFIRDRRLHR